MAQSSSITTSSARAWTPHRFDELLSRATAAREQSRFRPSSDLDIPTRLLGMPLSASHPGGTVGHSECSVWQLSDSFLHIFARGFLHVGTECAVTLTTTDEERVTVQGVVTECQHLCGLEHAASIRIDKDSRAKSGYDLIRFASSAAVRKQIEARRQETNRIEGSALVVGRRSSTTQLAEFTLGRMGLELRAAESEGEVTECLAASGHVDLLLIDDCPGPEGTGLDLAKRVRESWMSLPIIIMTIQGTDALPPELLASPFLMLLEKPFDRMELAGAVRKILSVNQNAEDQVLRSALESDLEIKHIIREFVGRIPESIERVESACRRGPVGAIAHEIRRIAEDSLIVGFFLLGEMFMQTWNKIDTAENVAQARGYCEDVLPHLRRLYGLQRG